MDGASDQKSLEDQLRNMMLGNIRMAEPQSQRQQQAYGQQYRNPRQDRSQPGRQQQQQHYQSRPPPSQQYQQRGGFPNNHSRQQPQHGVHVPPHQRQGFNQFVAQHASAPQLVLDNPSPQSPQSGYQQKPHGTFDPNAFQRGPPAAGNVQQHQQNRQLWQSRDQTYQQSYAPRLSPFALQSQYLDHIAAIHISQVEMTSEELQQKDSFRSALENICRAVSVAAPDNKRTSISLQNFGSLRSGFALKGSDMDLVVVSNQPDQAELLFSLDKDSLPRLLEAQLLHLGYGARLLSRTRVPIIKICKEPSIELLEALRTERARWDALSEEDKAKEEKSGRNQPKASKEGADVTAAKEAHSDAKPGESSTSPVTTQDKNEQPVLADAKQSENAQEERHGAQVDNLSTDNKQIRRRPNGKSQRPWSREKQMGPLDFPKEGVGIQCDINFFNPLGLHNTGMLRCYSLCDPRVRPMVLFVKAWAKRRKINHPYSGTLSSYGYVLMVLHYLVNVAHPPVLPNLQLRAETSNLPSITIDGYEVRFWGNEEEILQAVRGGQLTLNQDSLGALLRGFYQYYAQVIQYRGFVWTQDVLSLRTPGGIISKAAKGWTGAKTETKDTKEVRHRYLFAIEDPFELSHNVARTVTHPGICAIRDEFRRVYRILGAVGRGTEPEDGSLFDELVEEQPQETINVPTPHVPQT